MITTQDIFLEQLDSSEHFEQMLGKTYYRQEATFNPKAQLRNLFSIDWVEHRWAEPTEPSNWYKFSPSSQSKEYSYLQIVPLFDDLLLRILYTEPKYRRKKIASKAAKELMSQLGKFNEESEETLSLIIVPMPFDPMGYLPAINDDWTGEFYFKSESHSELEEQGCQKVLTTKELTRWYLKLGFSISKDDCLREFMSAYGLEIGREVLVWPKISLNNTVF